MKWPQFPDDICKCIFLNENAWISIKMLMKFTPKGPIYNNLALVHMIITSYKKLLLFIYVIRNLNLTDYKY